MTRLLLFACALAVSVALSSISCADVVDNSGAGFGFPDNDPGGASSSIIIDLPINEVIYDVEITLFGASHSWVGDLIVTIGNTQRGTVDLAARVGQLGGVGSGDSSDLGGDYTFVDFGGGADFWSAAGSAGGADTISPGVYGATTFDGAPVSLSTFFGGGRVNDTWTLSVTDNAGGDLGSINGWGITLTSIPVIPEPSSIAILGALGVAGLLRRRR